LFNQYMLPRHNELQQSGRSLGRVTGQNWRECWGHCACRRTISDGRRGRPPMPRYKAERTAQSFSHKIQMPHRVPSGIFARFDPVQRLDFAIHVDLLQDADKAQRYHMLIALSKNSPRQPEATCNKRVQSTRSGSTFRGPPSK